MDVRLLQVPYDSGWRYERMGRGPGRLMAAGAAEAARAGGAAAVAVVAIEAGAAFPSEIGTSFELNGLVAEALAEAAGAGAFPLVLAGNCNAAIGIVSGLQAAGGPPVGVVWLDGHGDFNTPETSTTGFLDGMGLAVLAGRCWQPIARTVPGYAPLPEAQIALVGARDLDPGEAEALAASEVTQVSCPAIAERGAPAALAPALDALAARAGRVYLHIDVDVHDRERAPGNALNPPGGLAPEAVVETVAAVAARLPIAAAAVTAYDPAVDTAAGGTAEAALAEIAALVRAAAG